MELYQWSAWLSLFAIVTIMGIVINKRSVSKKKHGPFDTQMHKKVWFQTISISILLFFGMFYMIRVLP